MNDFFTDEKNSIIIAEGSGKKTIFYENMIKITSECPTPGT
jgi:hypothetical protein